MIGGTCGTTGETFAVIRGTSGVTEGTNGRTDANY